jgi:RNase adaptor protein for sRNA GlmZ degradation
MDLLLLGGVSGSGKSVALGALEDCGYYAVNNLPLPLVAATARYLADAGRNRVQAARTSKQSATFSSESTHSVITL